jgi:aminoglycoside phosphotransferase (APT) family kinase protein
MDVPRPKLTTHRASISPTLAGHGDGGVAEQHHGGQMPSSVGFDPTSLQSTLQAWLARQMPDATDVAVSGLHAPTATGHSSETVLFDASWSNAGTAHAASYVLRTAPSGHTVFPSYDLGEQFAVMTLVGTHAPTVPLPPLRWYEPDPSVIGGEFIVMGRVDGQIPPDRLPYTMEGWLLEESSPEQQRELQDSAIDALADIHAIDWRTTGLDLLDHPTFGVIGLDQQLHFYEDFLEWGRCDHPHERFVEVGRWLRANRPAPEPAPVLNWGDARIGNIIFQDHRPAAVLDWEMATLGPRQVDVAWFCLFERFFSQELGMANLPGFAPMADVVARYEARAGVTLGDLGWYTAWAAYRYALIMMRICQADTIAEIDGFPEDDNVATIMLDHVMDEVA